MKSVRMLLAVLSVSAPMLAVGEMACKLTPAEKTTVNTVLDVVTYACIIANANSTDEALQKACGIVQDEMPIVKKVIADFTKKRDEYAAMQVDKYAAAHTGACLSADAGAR